MNFADKNTENAVKKVVAKKTRTEKFSLAYILNMQSNSLYSHYSIFVDSYKRNEIVEKFNEAFETNIL